MKLRQARNKDGRQIINLIRKCYRDYSGCYLDVENDSPELKADGAVIKKEGTQLGVIAQEIEKFLPEVVKTEDTGVKSVNPDNMTWYLVNAVKELSAEVEKLKNGS